MGASPDGVDHWRCRFLADHPRHDLAADELGAFPRKIELNGVRWMHLERLSHFDGSAAYTEAQGEN
jgi:hypothetical protein